MQQLPEGGIAGALVLPRGIPSRPIFGYRHRICNTHSVSSPDETLRRELKIWRATEYFWQTLRCFIWWWNTKSNAWYYYSNKMILDGEINNVKTSSFSSDWLLVNILMFKISFVFSLWIINEFEKFRETKGKAQIAKLDDWNHKRVVFTSACLRTRRSRMLLWLKVIPWQIMVKKSHICK